MFRFLISILLIYNWLIITINNISFQQTKIIENGNFSNSILLKSIFKDSIQYNLIFKNININNLKAGNTFAYCLSPILDKVFGPYPSNRVETKIVNELITELNILKTKTITDTVNLNKYISLTKIKFEKKLLNLTQNNELLKIISKLKSKEVVTNKFTFKQISELFIKANLNLNITGQEFLQLLLSNKLITQKTYSYLIEFLTSNGISLNESANTIIEYLDSKGVILNLKLGRLIEFLSNYGVLDEQIILKLKDNFTSIGINTSVLSKYLKDTFNNISLKSEINQKKLMQDTSNIHLITEISSLAPKLKLLKKVNRNRVFVGQTLMYEIFIKNIGNVPVNKTFIFDVMPLGVTLIEESIQSSFDNSEHKIIKDNDKTCIVWIINQNLMPSSRNENYAGKVSFKVIIKK